MLSAEQDEGNESCRNPQQPRMLEAGIRRPELLVDVF
jgi:hypothetical protein